VDFGFAGFPGVAVFPAPADLAADGDGVPRRPWRLALTAGVEDDPAAAAGTVIVGCGEAPEPAWKPVRDAAEPWPGETSTNAATTTPARASGPNPNSSTLASLPRLLRQAGRRPAGREDPGILPGSREPTPRLGVAGAA
jgi:hypothetical protein